MNYYKLHNKIIISKEKQKLPAISEKEASLCNNQIYMLYNANPINSRMSYSVSDASLLNSKTEDLQLLQSPSSTSLVGIPNWIIEKVNLQGIKAINTGYPKWKSALDFNKPKKWKVNVVGLGDVGGTLVTGLRLLGGDCISSIGIYDIDDNKLNRWKFEAGQIFSIDSSTNYPNVYSLSESEIYDCDMFVFCVTVGVPPLDGSNKDVRMQQFEGNSKIINQYAKKARENNYNGVFAVVSDPVDLLCKSAFLSSNKNEQDKLDFNGLASDQIRGYGLGVMHARAVYYSKQNKEYNKYEHSGRAYGPHGEHLIIANDIYNYNNEASLWLTTKARLANQDVRATGYKPYIAPALSSGTLSLIATIKGDWHYSATFLGGVYMGAKNRLTKSGVELERLKLHEKLLERIHDTYKKLESVI